MRLYRVSTLIALAFVLAAPPAPVRADASHAEAELGAVDAVWMTQSFEFQYAGDATSYSCGSLRRRVRSILMRVGAHESVAVRTIACYDLSEHTRVQVTMASPMEATPENIAALTTFDGADELVARLRGAALPGPADVEVFAAEWRTISMSRDKVLRLAPGDCELVQQLRQQVFPRMAIRVLKDDVRCSRVFGSITRPRLQVAALAAKAQD